MDCTLTAEYSRSWSVVGVECSPTGKGREVVTVADFREELVPLKTAFDKRWRGYAPDQVRTYVSRVEADIRLLIADRDAAVARAESLADQLEVARSEIADLRRHIDRICRTPVEPDALSERLERMTELAHEEAEEITTRARAASDQAWTTAHQAAAQLRRRSEHLVAELDRRRAEMEFEHRELVHRAHEQVETMTRQAEQRRRELDTQDAQLRTQVMADFEQAMAIRRAEAMRAVTEQRRTADAHAKKTILGATEHAQGIVADAQQRVDALRQQRDRIAEGLRTTQLLLTGTEPLLQPLPEETSLPRPREEIGRDNPARVTAP